MRQAKNGISKKLLSVLLTFVTVFAVGGGAPVRALACDCEATPIIYVLGEQPIYEFNEDGSVKRQLLADDDDQIDAAVSELLPMFAKALVTDEWNEYCNRFYELIAPLFDDITLNPDGTVPANTGVNWRWSPDTIPAYHDANSDLYRYQYLYDYRLSPMDLADDLHAYIKAVEEKTGHDSVILMSRCGGTNLVAAYLQKYQEPIGYADVEKVVFICGNLLGVDFVEAFFSGTIDVNKEALYRWAKNYNLEDYIDPKYVDVIYTVIDMLQGTGGMDMLVSRAMHVYEKIKDPLIARTLKKYHALNFGFICFVNDRYEEYKDYIFQEEGDKEKYAAIIAKADDYHYNVQLRTNELLLDMADHGVEVDTIAYYGDQTYPLMESASLTSDRITSVADESYGGTASNLSGTLSSDYIARKNAEGKGKYISPDKQIDASTGLFPDTTWYVKNAKHNFTHGSVDRLFMAVCRTKNATVENVPGYPQFLNDNMETDVLQPAQEVNENDVDWQAIEEESKFGFLNFLRKLIDWLKVLLDSLSKGIATLVAGVK